VNVCVLVDFDDNVVVVEMDLDVDMDVVVVDVDVNVVFGDGVDIFEYFCYFCGVGCCCVVEMCC
jgi:hypothetical protein